MIENYKNYLNNKHVFETMSFGKDVLNEMQYLPPHTINKTEDDFKIFYNLYDLMSMNNFDIKKTADFLNEIIDKNTELEIKDKIHNIYFRIDKNEIKILGLVENEKYGGMSKPYNCLLVVDKSDDSRYYFNVDHMDLKNFVFKLTKELKKGSKRTLYDYAMEAHPDMNSWYELQSINCFKQNLTSLDGTDKFPNVMYFNCSDNKLKTLNGIEKLTKLRYLYCNNNKLKIIAGLEGFKDLRTLECEGNDFSDEYKKYLQKFCDLKSITYIPGN